MSLFAEPAEVDAPFLEQFGLPTRFSGQVAIRRACGLLRALGADTISTTLTRVIFESETEVVGEYALLGAASGRPGFRRFVVRVIANAGAIELVRVIPQRTRR